MNNPALDLDNQVLDESSEVAPAAMTVDAPEPRSAPKPDIAAMIRKGLETSALGQKSEAWVFRAVVVLEEELGRATDNFRNEVRFSDLSMTPGEANAICTMGADLAANKTLTPDQFETARRLAIINLNILASVARDKPTKDKQEAKAVVGSIVAGLVASRLDAETSEVLKLLNETGNAFGYTYSIAEDGRIVQTRQSRDTK